MTESESTKCIMREYLPMPDEDRYTVEFDAPYGAEFIGVQNDAKIVLMLVRSAVVEHFERHGQATQRRTVIRVKDEGVVDSKSTRYIGSNRAWHLFEILPVRT
jgi:hypothetical protein